MISSSSTSSAIGTASISGVPGFASTSSTAIPSDSSPICISVSERIIPFDSIPLSFAFFSLSPVGSTAPGRATATVWPAATLGAPQTIVRISSPVSTSQTRSLSASGWSATASTRPTT